MIQMHVAGISVDQNSGGAVLFLQDDSEQTLPIWIGLAEATAIAKEMEGVELARPLTHDLFRDVLRATGVELSQVEVIDLRDNTYFAELVLRDSSGSVVRIDSRPSDAVVAGNVTQILVRALQAGGGYAPDCAPARRASRANRGR